MALYRDSVTGEQYEIPDGTAPEVAQQIVQRQTYGRRLLNGGQATALAGMLGDAQAAHPVQPTLSGVSGGRVVGLGLQGTRDMNQQIQQSNSDVLRANEERGRQMLAMQEKEKDRQNELKMRQEQLRTAFSERKLMTDQAKYAAKVKEDAENHKEELKTQREMSRPLKGTPGTQFIDRTDGHTIASIPEKPPAPHYVMGPNGSVNLNDPTAQPDARTAPLVKPILPRFYDNHNELGEDGQMHQVEYQPDPNSDPRNPAYFKLDHGVIPAKTTAANKPSSAAINKKMEELVAQNMPRETAYATAVKALT